MTDGAVLPNLRRAHEADAWRRRSRRVRQLRRILPALVGLILLVLAGYLAQAMFAAPRTRPVEASTPIQLVSPKFVGQDRKGRAFTLTARTATRDPADYDRVVLDQPVLLLRRDPGEPIRVSARTGDFNESDHILKLQGDVRLNSGDISFATGASTFDTALGELVGDGAIQGVGSLGEINAKSYGVYDRGDRLVFGGGVSTRLEPRSGP
ncbi:MAG: LPS export ABC transporter periplasmic protein LptC [Phenylobacterium sp.]|uniref:LPS export ABC transporter periplasmic protein LptC n=1 Tax=Phenylobacterium sp. TaxID=1871053 RepID=UPI0025F490E5|nr:LPS export ABC transporter periplasmic protein LptC [Phenylobacterium sp.]MCA6296155.1 LPS export ABC transporter periplasmic protein LptC [Phenylobacterium sp.]MCA6298908.1 LPS export ABC transporter periplasmic protein LptC [Phenylobacterium sp.]